MGLGFDEVSHHPFTLEIFLGELSETIAPDLADEARRRSASAGPDGDVGRTSSRCQHHLAEGVATSQQFAVGANEHVPGKVSENAELRCRRTGCGHGSYGIGGDSPSHEVVGDNGFMPRAFGRLTVVSLAAVWVIWGSTYLAIKIGLETLPPFAMQGMRFVVASTFMLMFLRLRGRQWPSKRQVRNACGIGLLLLIGGLGMVTLAEDRGVDSGLVATIIAIQPMMMALWGGLWRTWPNRMQWVGMSIGLLGVLVLVSDDGLSGSWSGVSLVFVACVSWSFGSALSRRIDMPDGPMTTALEMASAAGGFIVLSLVTGESIDAPSLRSGLAVGYLVVFGSIVAFSAFTYLIGNVSGPLAMSYAYINPAIAVLLGVVFSDETVSVNMATALPVILVGVAIVTNASRPPDTTTVEDASTVRP
jgi:drug/metabolite transporter (DMT)-like permease